MKTLSEYGVIAQFLGDDCTEKQAVDFADAAVRDLSTEELQQLLFYVDGEARTKLRERLAEKGEY